MENSPRIQYDTLRSLAFGAIGAVYAGIGPSFPYPMRILRVCNNTDADLLISFDGITDQDFIAANSAYVYDYSTNKSNQVGFLEQAAGTRIYCKQNSAGPTRGSIFVTAIYIN